MIDIKKIIKKSYEFKIYTTTRFAWGFGEIASYVNLVKDVAIILGFFVLVFRIHLSVGASIAICLAVFILCVVGGIVLERTGMLKYAAEITNKQNPQMNKLDEIHRSLKIKPEQNKIKT